MLAKVATSLRDLPNKVRLEGHTDSIPIHTARFRNNWELSAARGIAMLDVLSAKYAIPAERFAIAGYADTSPVASNDTEEGRKRNRRVDIVVLNRLTALPDSGPAPAVAKSEAKSGETKSEAKPGTAKPEANPQSVKPG